MRPSSALRAMRLAWLTASLMILPTNAYQTTRTGLVARDETSCKAVDSRLPEDFICESGTSCISLDNGSSALCCPTDRDCGNIQRISCDVSNLNVTAQPTSGIFTTRLDDDLPVCGNRCCPFGYACVEQTNSDPICNLITGTSQIAQSETNSSTSSTTSTTSTASSSTRTSSTSELPTSTSTSGATSAAVTTEPQCNKFPAGVFLAGFFPGMFIGAFIMLAWVICTGRHRKPDSNRSSAGSSLYKPKISDPIPMQQSGIRTDFLRRGRGRAKSMFSSKSPTESPGKSRISPKFMPTHWKMPTPPDPNNLPTSIAAGPVTPERRMPGQRISESEASSLSRDFTPPSAAPQYPPPASIAPLRGMTSQRPQIPPRQPEADNKMGSPFQTPPGNAVHPAYRTQSRETTFSGFSDLNGAPMTEETLSPSRYEGGAYSAKGGIVRSDSPVRPSRPTTTFTEMMQSTGFEERPKVPKIPKGYGRR